MDINHWRVIGAMLLFIFIFLSGFRLSRSGKPYNPILLNAHKLVSLAVAVFLAIAVARSSQAASLGATELAIIALVLFAITMISGGLLSTTRPMPAAIRTVHRLAPYLAALSTALALYLL